MKHLFFDLDRTLWDFERNSKQALQDMFVNHNLGNYMKSFESFHHAYKNINAKLWQQYGKGKITKEELRSKRFNDTLKQFQVNNPELAIQLGDEYVSTSPFQTHIFPGTHEVLTQLKNDDFKLHIITNGFKEVQFIKLKQCDLLPYFDIILCSEEVGENKPSINVFNHALKSAKAKAKESVMIGDDYHVDVIGAENAGMAGILFDPRNNYKSGTHNWQINHLEEVPGLIPWIAKSNL